MHRVLVMNQGRVKVNAIVCSPVRHITLSNWAAIFHTDSQKGTQAENRLPSDFQCPLEDVSCVNTQQRRTYNFASNGFQTHFQNKIHFCLSKPVETPLFDSTVNEFHKVI